VPTKRSPLVPVKWAYILGRSFPFAIFGIVWILYYVSVGVLAALFSEVSFFDSLPTSPIPWIFAALTIIAPLIADVSWHNTAYTLDGDTLTVTQGLVSRRTFTVSLPDYSVQLRRSLFDRLFRTSRPGTILLRSSDRDADHSIVALHHIPQAKEVHLRLSEHIGA